MKLEKWTQVAEIVASLAVVVSVVFLTMSIRENSRITSATAYANNLAEHNAQSNIVMQDPELIRLVSAFRNREAQNLDELSRGRLNQYVQTMFRIYESAYFDNQLGLLEPEQWERSERLICINFDAAKSNGYSELLDALMTSEFLQFMQDCPTEGG
jgi:hypothetical protein